MYPVLPNIPRLVLILCYPQFLVSLLSLSETLFFPSRLSSPFLKHLLSYEDLQYLDLIRNRRRNFQPCFRLEP